MAFPHSGFGHQSLDDAARRAIEIHNKAPHLLSPEEEKLRSAEHTGVELTGAELAVVRKVIFDWMRTTEKKIPELERAIGEGSAINTSIAEEELHRLRQTDNFLRHNLAEKLFGETNDTGPTAH